MELCDLASKHFPDALFLHVTAYSETRGPETLRRALKGAGTRPAYLVEKNTDWPNNCSRASRRLVEKRWMLSSAGLAFGALVQQRGSATLSLRTDGGN